MLNFASHTNHRKHPRHRVLKEGKIISSVTPSIIDVTIRDLSVGGARIQLPHSMELPREFSLWVTSEKMLYPVTAKWHEGELMGLAFINEPHHVPLIDFKKLH